MSEEAQSIFIQDQQRVGRMVTSANKAINYSCPFVVKFIE